MGPLLRSGAGRTCQFLRFSLLFFSALLLQSYAQSSLRCTPTATNLVDLAEGLAEPSGDILLACSGGAPGSSVTFNFSIAYPVTVTNRLNAAGVPDAVLTVDTGTGPVPNAAPVLLAQNVLAFNGITFVIPASGNVGIRVSNVRLAVSLASPGQTLNASLSSTGLLFSSATVVVATPNRGLLANFASNGITCFGSPLPTFITFSNLLTAGSIFSSTRVTEGFASAFIPKDSFSDAGTRFLVSYSGFPAGARVFIPDLVAGSDAVQPTAAGDLGGTQSGGMYAPKPGGSLLLARVVNADSSGAGGSPITTAAGVTPNVVFNNVTEVSLANGSASVVYEVIDSNPVAQENAQFPTFIGWAAGQNQNPVVAGELLSLAPVSAITTAVPGLPVPRFAASAPPSDCQIVGDCGASYFPILNAFPTSFQFTSPFLGAPQTDYVEVNNNGGGYLGFSFSLAFQGTGGWLTVVNQTGSTNNTNLRLTLVPGTLPQGSYTATLTINAGSAGSQNISIKLTIGPPQIAITSVTNAATLQAGPLVAGSLATIKGRNFGGKAVNVTFGGVPGTVLYSDSQQINVQVPASIVANTSTQVVVTVDGISSAAQTIQLANVAPGIFGVLNQDNSINSATNSAAAGTAIQIFATGLIAPVSQGPVRVGLGSALIPTLYSGAFPNGLQQVNSQIPAGTSPGPSPLAVCVLISTSQQQVCSPSFSLFVK